MKARALLVLLALVVGLLIGTAAVQADEGTTRVYLVNETSVPLTMHVQGSPGQNCRATQAIPRCSIVTPSGYRTLVATFDDGTEALIESYDLPPGEPFLWTVSEKKE